MDKNKALRISAAVLAVVLCVSYVLYQIVSASKAKMETQIAVMATEYKTIDTKCFIVRDEAFLKNSVTGTTVSFVGDGERVASGDTVSMVFSNTADAKTYSEIKELEDEIKHYSVLSGQANIQVRDINSIDALINNNLVNYLTSVDNADFSTAKSRADTLRDSITSKQIATGATLDYDTHLAELKNRLSALQSAKVSYTEIKADAAGYYISGSDGYEEAIDYKKIDSLTKEDIEKAIKSSPQSVHSDMAGRLVSEFTWYILTVVDSESTVNIKNGEELSVNFPYAGIEKLPVKVYKLGDRSGEKTTLILSCELMNSTLSDFRIEDIQIIESEYSGYKIPNSAIRTLDGETGVYVVSGNLLGFRKIHVAYSDDNYSIVDNPENESDYIRLYDKVVTKGVELYDDKLV